LFVSRASSVPLAVENQPTNLKPVAGVATAVAV